MERRSRDGCRNIGAVRGEDPDGEKLDRILMGSAPFIFFARLTDELGIRAWIRNGDRMNRPMVVTMALVGLPLAGDLLSGCQSETGIAGGLPQYPVGAPL